MSTMGVDVGTTGCKAVVFDSQGCELAQAYREYALLRPQPGWAELDSAQVMSLSLDAIREAARAAGDPVVGLSISSQGEAFTPVDAEGRILGNAMVSSDARAAGCVAEWSDRLGVEKLYQITGHTPHPLFTLFKLLWLRDHQPDIWRAADKFLCFEDLLCQRLGFEPTMGWSLAGRTMLFDVRRHEWSPYILDAIGLKAERLARLEPAGHVAGRLSAARTEALGLAPDALLVTGGHDQPCGALGAGVVEEGLAMYAMGTVECICPAFSKPVFSAELRSSNLSTFDFTLPGMYTTVAYSLTGGNLLRWYRDELAGTERAEAERTGRNVYELILAGLPTQPAEPMVLPYFTSSGTPNFDTRTPGAIAGLRLATTRGEILRALLEGVALEMRLNLDRLNRSGVVIRELRAIGGGARSAALTQLKSDVLDRPIHTVAVPEAGCLGVAMLAHAAVTGEDVRALAQNWVRVTAVVEPNPATRAHYAGRFGEYQRLYRHMHDLYAERRTF